MLVGVMLAADFSGANETRERDFQAALLEAFTVRLERHRQKAGDFFDKDDT